MSDLTFSTSIIDGPRKLDAWREAFCQAFGPIEAHRLDDLDFGGSIRTTERAQLQFNELSYRGLAVERTAQNIARFDQEFFTFGRVSSGPVYIKQNDRDVVVDSGSVILANQSAPYKARVADCYRSSSISIPSKLLQQRCPRIGSFFGFQVDANSPRGQLLTTFAKNLSDGIAGWSDAEAVTLRDRMLDLIVMLMVDQASECSATSETSAKAAHRERAIIYLKQHHRDASLGPKAIAEACGVSVNYLHQVFRSANLHVADLVCEHRLATGKTLLLDPASRRKTVQEIALQSGFSQASHFTRRFKEKFGMAPRDFRLSGGVAEFRAFGKPPVPQAG